jgi:hypothetical protein
MADPLQFLLNSALDNNQFPPTSRYAGVEIATLETPDGRTISHLRRRFLPPGDAFTLLQEHAVKEGERLDQISTTYLGDPEQFWRICDANEAMEPNELVSTPGNIIRITLPQGVAGSPDA